MMGSNENQYTLTLNKLNVILARKRQKAMSKTSLITTATSDAIIPNINDIDYYDESPTVYCHKCNEQLQIGDEIISKRVSDYSKHYHILCYTEMFLE